MTVKEKLEKYNQTHLLAFENELTLIQRASLYKQIEELDFSYLEHLNKTTTEQQTTISPIKPLTISEIATNHQTFEDIGLTALENEEIGILLLAGGMGTRLGSENPKGCFNIGKTKPIYIFQRLFENTLKVVEQCGKFIPFFIMTSDKNHEETINFLTEHNFFGYNPNYVVFFKQDMAPCVDLNGKILLESKNRIATSPNGNGGWFNSLLKSEKAKQMLEHFNLKWLNIFAVDNVLQQIADPVFIGATLSGNYDIGAKAIRKADPYEKIGVLCNKNGRTSIVEYIDLTDDMAHAKNEKGEYLYNFGVILNYLFSVDLLYEIKDKQLPVHVVTKKVEHINEQGELIKPQVPNAHKFEMLCVDMIEFSHNCLPYEVTREKEFAPIKNLTGIDSVESAQSLLEKNGYEL